MKDFGEMMVLSIAIGLFIGAFVSSMVFHSRGRLSVQIEAVQKQYAYWEPDVNGDTVFKWKAQPLTPEKGGK